MSANSPTWSATCARFGRWVALVLFLAAQLSSGAIARNAGPADARLAALDAAMVVCAGTNHATPGSLPPIHHHLQDPALAAFTHHAAQQAALLQADAILAPSPLSQILWTVRPPSCAPPARFATAAYPTGPPSSLI